MTLRHIFAYGRVVEDSPKLDGALLVASCLIAVIRLRGQEIKPSPKLTATIKDSVELARLIPEQLRQRR